MQAVERLFHVPPSLGQNKLRPQSPHTFVGKSKANLCAPGHQALGERLPPQANAILHFRGIKVPSQSLSQMPSGSLPPSAKVSRDDHALFLYPLGLNVTDQAAEAKPIKLFALESALFRWKMEEEGPSLSRERFVDDLGKSYITSAHPPSARTPSHGSRDFKGGWEM